MPYYRLYHFTNGHIRSFEELEEEDDEQAVAVARLRAAGKTSELWQRGRRVAAFPEKS